jgi:oxalate decarboxylase/phosphoglucose isomerase-like protein (cupin superfamily)
MSIGYLPGYEQHAMQNIERRPLQFALIVPPPAEYKSLHLSGQLAKNPHITH